MVLPTQDLARVGNGAAPDAIVRVSGELDLFTTHQLSHRLHEAVESGCRRVLLDLVDVSFADAGALRVLDRFRTQLAETDGSLRIVGWSPRVTSNTRLRVYAQTVDEPGREIDNQFSRDTLKLGRVHLRGDVQPGNASQARPDRMRP